MLLRKNQHGAVICATPPCRKHKHLVVGPDGLSRCPPHNLWMKCVLLKPTTPKKKLERQSSLVECAKTTAMVLAALNLDIDPVDILLAQ